MKLKHQSVRVQQNKQGQRGSRQDIIDDGQNN